VPTIRPFRALRYDRATIGDPALVVAPPYDVIGPAEADRLAARHPANVVRLDLPREQPGDEPDDRYRRAARTLAAWRSDGTLHKDPHPSIYVYEQTYRLPGTEVERTQRGFFGRLLLEPLGPESGVLPHERTLAAPREDRYKLLRAAGVNTSPIVALYDDEDGAGAAVLAAATERAPDVEVVDDDGVCHRMWAVAADGEGVERVAPLLAAAGSRPLTIADGHHRYETALRYRDERRMSRSCEEDPAFDYVLALLVHAGQPLTVLPTHRIVRGLGDDGVMRLMGGLGELFDVEWGVSEADRDRRGRRGPVRPLDTIGRIGPSGPARGVRRGHGRPRRGRPGPGRHPARHRPGSSGRHRRGVGRGRAGRLHEVGRRGDRCRGRRPGRRGRGVPPRADPGLLGPRGRRRGRRHAPEVDLLLSQGPDRPRHQPARVVNP
jgi:uncharacterized protein (DUF1015 family)